MISESQAHRYCSEPLEKIENYTAAIADSTQVWHCHHRLEVQGQFINSAKLLKKCGMYFNRPACELIFLTESEHHSLHSSHMPEDARRRISDANKGKTISEEHRLNLSVAMKGNTNTTGMLWWHNGTINKRAKECPGEGWTAGRYYSQDTMEKLKRRLSESLKGHPPYKGMTGKHHSEKTKQKMKDIHSNTKWWNNGVIGKKVKECPGPGWVRGMLKKKKKKKKKD